MTVAWSFCENHCVSSSSENSFHWNKITLNLCHIHFSSKLIMQLSILLRYTRQRQTYGYIKDKATRDFFVIFRGVIFVYYLLRGRILSKFETRSTRSDQEKEKRKLRFSQRSGSQKLYLIALVHSAEFFISNTVFQICHRRGPK